MAEQSDEVERASHEFARVASNIAIKNSSKHSQNNESNNAHQQQYYPYTKAVIRFSKLPFLWTAFLISIEAIFFVGQVQFLIKILQFLQDEALKKNPSVRDVYLNALGLVLCTFL